ncbi:Ankyrin Repeat Domain-Containing Protein 19-Like [Manis pentadactyla]|nr:Ankyrin Repeat Domain-Containing Protein 19-Like [Manis pentadactyla]
MAAGEWRSPEARGFVMMKRIFGSWGLKCWPCLCPFSRVRPTNVEDYCQGVNFQAQYHIRSKDVRKIHRAATKGKVAKVQQILFMGENGLNDRDKRNRTALHLACANGHAEVVTVLVERNCKLNLCDNLERTPLIKAVQCHQEDCARILLDYGADPNVSDVYGNTALHYAACGERLTTAAQLLEHTADIEASNKEGFTPLLLAVSRRNYKMTEYLLSEGADVHAVDNYERTALMLAIDNGSTDIVNLLQEEIDALSQDTHGWTGAEYTHSRGFNMYKVDKGIKNSQNKRKSSPGSRGKYPCLETITEEDSLSDMTIAEKATKTSRAGCRAKYHHLKPATEARDSACYRTVIDKATQVPTAGCRAKYHHREPATEAEDTACRRAVVDKATQVPTTGC